VMHPENLYFVHGAASWSMFTTACGALIALGNLHAAATVHIGTAAGSAGVVAIQMDNMVRAEPDALNRTSHKRQARVEAGAAHVIAIEEQDLIDEVMSITDGKGARMAFDPVGGAYAGKIFKVLSMQGIFFQYGALDAQDIPVPVMDVLGKHLTLWGYELFE